MAQITVKSNVAEVAKDWQKLAKAYKKTVISGLNSTAYRVARREMPQIMSEGLDRPVKYTRNAGRYEKATEARPTAVVGVFRDQEAYLQKPVFGGRTDKGKAVPVGIRLDRFGNIKDLRAGQKIKELLAKPNVFAATFGGVSGIFQRQAKRLKMLVYFSGGTFRYRKTFDWHKGVRKAAEQQLPIAMNKAINRTVQREAQRTVRRVLR